MKLTENDKYKYEHAKVVLEQGSLCEMRTTWFQQTIVKIRFNIVKIRFNI